MKLSRPYLRWNALGAMRGIAAAAAACLAWSVAAQTISPLPQANVPQRPLPLYNNPGVLSRPGLPEGRLPQGTLPQRDTPQGFIPSTTLPQGASPSANVPRAALPQGYAPQANLPLNGAVPQLQNSSDLTSRVPVPTGVPGNVKQTPAYQALANPQSTNDVPPTPVTPIAMLGGRVLATGQDEVTVKILKTPRFYDAEIWMIAPEQRLLGTNFSAGQVIALGRVAAGEVIFGMKVYSTGLMYPTGPGIRNPDGMPHAVVQIGGSQAAPLVYVGFEDVMSELTLYRGFNDVVLEISGVEPAITPLPDPRTTPPAAPAAKGAKNKPVKAGKPAKTATPAK